MIPTLISKIYVINLESCEDRRKHIKNEFNRLNITDYEIFKATDKNSVQVRDMMKTDFVKKFPPCFRCNKNKCNCPNNILIEPQIANWCSFINVMNDIIKNDYQDLIMICEDDIKFIDNGPEILNKMITRENLQNYNIDFAKPILIRAGSAYSNEHESNSFPHFNKEPKMSNPCFLCNKFYAKSFIKNLKTIKSTSDIYIHRTILSYDNTIQHFTIIPQPIYELSYGKYKKFKSEIHPKGIDKEDIIKKQTHFKKVEYKDFLCIGHPRCGTTSISYYLGQMGYDVRHENMGKDGVSSWMLAVRDDKYPWGNIKDKFRYYFKNIIHVLRNPFNAIPSIILEHKYSPNNESYKFKKKHIKKILGIDLPEVNFNKISLTQEIELALKTFIYWNKICEMSNPQTICKIEDISSIQKFNQRNMLINTSIKNSNKKYAGKSYQKPIITNDIYNTLDKDLIQELKVFCKKYDYEYTLDTIEVVIPFGSCCSSAYHLKQMGLKLFSLPFDWIFTNSKLILDILNNNFADFTNVNLINNIEHKLYHKRFFLHKPYSDNQNYYKRCINRFNNILISPLNKLFIHTIFSNFDNHKSFNNFVSPYNNYINEDLNDFKKLIDVLSKKTTNFILLVIIQIPFSKTPSIELIQNDKNLFVYNLNLKGNTSGNNFDYDIDTLNYKSIVNKFKFKLTDFQNEIQQKQEVFKINNNFNMYVPYSKTDGIFISLRNKNTWESNVTRALLYKFNELKIDTFIDIGANIGYYTLLFAFKNIKTYSFEPNLENFNLLNENIKLNNFQNCNTYNLGISDSHRELEFFYNKEKSGHGSFNKDIVKIQNLNLSKIIKVEKLDNIEISGENIMIKIDIEGYELNAIMGMINLLGSGKVKVFCIEISRTFYGSVVEEKIINLLKKYFTKLYIVQLKKRLVKIPTLNQYDLICS